MAEATCRRELELEIPAEEVTKKMEAWRRNSRGLANVPGFRRGKGASIADPAEVRGGHQGRSAAIAGARSALRKRWGGRN